MKKKGQPFIIVCCNMCGKPAPIDGETSNENWTVFKSGKCDCGGDYEFKAIYAKK